jgi:hypothetical protein
VDAVLDADHLGGEVVGLRCGLLHPGAGGARGLQVRAGPAMEFLAGPVGPAAVDRAEVEGAHPGEVLAAASPPRGHRADGILIGVGHVVYCDTWAHSASPGSGIGMSKPATADGRQRIDVQGNEVVRTHAPTMPGLLAFGPPMAGNCNPGELDQSLRASKQA